MNKFNWRAMKSAPRDGTPFVSLTVITHVGGHHRYCDLEPHLTIVHRTGASLKEGVGGYWRDTRGDFSVADDQLRNGFWTTIDEYRAAIPVEEWTLAPIDNVFGTGPLVFIRPWEPRGTYATKPVAKAITAWHKGHWDQQHNDLRWDTVNSTWGGQVSPGFLDGHNVSELPFRWCRMRDFFPTETFAQMITDAERERDYKVKRICEWLEGNDRG